jgi:hypothetical protein
VRRQPELLRELADHVGAEHVLQLLGRDGQVLPAADPRSDDVAEPALLELLHQPGQPATGLLMAQHADDGADQVAAASRAALLPAECTAQ